MYCTNCGTEIEDGAGYCPNCGCLSLYNNQPEYREQPKYDNQPEYGEQPKYDNQPEDEGSQGKTKKRKLGAILISVAALIVAAIAGVIIWFVCLPQVQVVGAFTKTMATATESKTNKVYGGYEMTAAMLAGMYDIEYTYYDEDGINYSSIYVKRDILEHKFIAGFGYTGIDPISSGYSKEINTGGAYIYADKDTSLIGLSKAENEKYAVQVDYGDDMKGRIGNSFLAAYIEKETLDTIADIYVDLMQIMTGNVKKDNGLDGLYKRTMEFFLELDAEKCDKRKFEVNGRDVKCRVYRIVFNPKDIAEYIEDCYEISMSAGTRVDDAVKDKTGYTMKELFDMLEEKAAKLENVDIYFAVNKKNELVSIYGENISKDNISFELNFHGGDYLCDEAEFKYSDGNGVEFTMSKDDVSDKNVLSQEYEMTFKEDADSDVEAVYLSYKIEDGRLTAAYKNDYGTDEIEMDIADYEKGKYIELKSDDGRAKLHIGCNTREIEKPVCSNTLNLLDANIIMAYSFFSDILQ